jgi:hypothetical protein
MTAQMPDAKLVLARELIPRGRIALQKKERLTFRSQLAMAWSGH